MKCFKFHEGTLFIAIGKYWPMLKKSLPTTKNMLHLHGYKKVFRENNILLVDWLLRSPDMYSLENAWNAMVSIFYENRKTLLMHYSSYRKLFIIIRQLYPHHIYQIEFECEYG